MQCCQVQRQEPFESKLMAVKTIQGSDRECPGLCISPCTDHIVWSRSCFTKEQSRPNSYAFLFRGRCLHSSGQGKGKGKRKHSSNRGPGKGPRRYSINCLKMHLISRKACSLDVRAHHSPNIRTVTEEEAVTGPQMWRGEQQESSLFFNC